ncbi:LysR family transcriptional regulator [Phycisphaeraceae bacterium D3-23]
MQTVRLFVEVARCRSFSKAAALFGISQSAASQRIGQLERRLGVKLIDRSVRPFELTQAGELYLVGAKDTLKKFDEMERKVSSMGAQPEALEGVVRVSAIYSFGIDLLGEIASAFERKMPGISVQISYLKPDAICNAVESQQDDFGIVSYPDRCKRVTVQALRDEVMAVVCGPGHALAKRRAVSAPELSEFGFVGFDLDLPIGRRIKTYLAEHGATPDVSHRFDNLDTLKGAVAVTDRIAILPKRSAQREINAGSLCAVRLTPKLTRPIGIITRRGSRPTPAAQAFMDELLARAGAEPNGSPQADTSTSR